MELNYTVILFFIDKKGVITSNFLKQFFATRANPFIDGLKLYANCQTGNTVKSNTLVYIGELCYTRALSIT